MPNDKKMYTFLLHSISDALDCLEKEQPQMAQRLLRYAQQKTEELYIAAEDAITLVERLA